MTKMKRRRKMKVRTRTTKKRPKLALTMMIWMSEMIPPTRMKKRKKIRNPPMKNLWNLKKQMKFFIQDNYEMWAGLRIV